MEKSTLEFIWKDKKRYLGMPLSFTRYSLSEDRLFLETGFLNLKTEEILLYRISDISLERKLTQRIFGVGTVRVLSSDKSMPELVIKNVKTPFDVKETIHKMVEEAKIKRRMHLSEITGDFGDDELM